MSSGNQVGEVMDTEKVGFLVKQWVGQKEDT